MRSIPTCALTERGAKEQADRYARLAPAVIAVRREPDALRVEFGAGLDRALLAEALAVERRCCPFFKFELNRRELHIGVREPDQGPALEVLAEALADGRSRGG